MSSLSLHNFRDETNAFENVNNNVTIPCLYETMKLSSICWRILLVLLPIAVVSTALLYLYPAVLGCAFPVPDIPNHDDLVKTVTAPFRLLVLADPQLEGDSSLPDPNAPYFPSIQELLSSNATLFENGTISAIRSATTSLVTRDVPSLLAAARKRLDLLGNDYYLAHIYRTLHWWTSPTHVTVLGDLLGSQWIKDDEFEYRGWRYWNRVFRHGKRVEDTIMEDDGRQEVLGDDPIWARRVINIAGNHDVGYAGDMSEKRLERFEHMFGRANWDITFNMPNASSAGNVSVTADHDPPTQSPAIRLVVLNSMNLDGPVLSSSLQSKTYEHINDHFIAPARPVTDRTTFTILLTHIPLHKRAGVCVDAPFFSYWPYFDEDDQDEDTPGEINTNSTDPSTVSGNRKSTRRKYANIASGGLKEQNHLSEHASRNILEGIFGMSARHNAEGGGKGRKGIVLTGHDHEGCDVVHYLAQNHNEAESESESFDKPDEADATDANDAWKVTRTHDTSAAKLEVASQPTLREITLRSMMGSYSGNAGLLSVWFDPAIGEAGEWNFGFVNCALGVQHWWWGVHVLDVVCFVVFGAGVVAALMERLAGTGGGRQGRKVKKA